jgi:hypothetical protein
LFCKSVDHTVIASLQFAGIRFVISVLLFQADTTVYIQFVLASVIAWHIGLFNASHIPPKLILITFILFVLA